MAKLSLVEDIVDKEFDIISKKIDNIHDSLFSYILSINILRGVYDCNYEVIIDNKLKRKMIEKTIESKERGIELGFNLYIDEMNVLKSDDYCEGNECSILHLFPSSGNFMGDFHTHKSSSSEPSFRDLDAIYIVGFGCIGGFVDEISTIRCYKRKSKFSELVKEKIKNISNFYEREDIKFQELREIELKKHNKWIEKQFLSEDEAAIESNKINESYRKLLKVYEEYLKIRDKKHNYILNKYFDIIEII
jgi:hypothetical protein